MGYRQMVLRLRIAAVVLVLAGLVLLAAPARTLGLDCGSPLSPRRPSAAQAWNDSYELQGVVAHCPIYLRARRAVGAFAVLGALVAIALPAFVARRRPGGGPTDQQRLVVLRTAAAGLLLVAIGAPLVSTHHRLTLCGSPISPADHHEPGCDLRLGARWVVAGAAGAGAMGAAGLSVAVARRRRDEGLTALASPAASAPTWPPLS